jgi:hypothetical protein
LPAGDAKLVFDSAARLLDGKVSKTDEAPVLDFAVVDSRVASRASRARRLARRALSTHSDTAAAPDEVR